MLMHIGSSEEISLLEFNKEEEEDQQETAQAIALGEEEKTLKDPLSAQIIDQPLSSKVSPRAF